MKISLFLYIPVLLWCVLGSSTLAEGDSTPIVLWEQFNPQFEPERAFFFADVPGQRGLYRSEGVFVPLSGDSEGERKWYVAAALQVDTEVAELVYSAVIVGKADSFEFIPPREWSSKENPEARLNLEEMQAHLHASTEELASWKDQYLAQEASIDRLKGDATVIARLERVETMISRIDTMRERIKGVEQDIANLQKFLKLARATEEPRNFARRERELVKQLKELAEAAKEAENSELTRRAMGEEQLQNDLRVIEATRSLSTDRLEARLLELRRRRIELEGKIGIPPKNIESADEYLQ